MTDQGSSASSDQPVLAIVDGDGVEAARIMQAVDLLPLFTGLPGVAVALADHASGGDRSCLRSVLERLASDPDLTRKGKRRAAAAAVAR